MYSFQNDSLNDTRNILSFYVSADYPLSIADSDHNIKNRIGEIILRDSRRNFILFDKEVYMKEFPCYREQDLTINELRELYVDNLNLHVMIIREP